MVSSDTAPFLAGKLRELSAGLDAYGFPKPSLKRIRTMQKYFLAAVFVVALAGPAFAEEFYVAFDPASHKCSMMHSQPASPMKSMGKFGTKAEAEKAMSSMKECTAG